MFSDDDALVAALKAHNIDAIEDVPATAIATLKKAGFADPGRPRRRPDRLHLQLEPEEAEEPRAAQPDAPRRRSTTRSTARRSCEVVFLGSPSPAGRSIPPATGAVGEPGDHSRRASTSRSRTSCSTASGSSGAPDGIRVADGHKMSYTVITPTDLHERQPELPDHPGRLPEDRRAALQKALDSSAAFDAITAPNTQVPELRPRDVGLGRPPRSRTSCSRS